MKGLALLFSHVAIGLVGWGVAAGFRPGISREVQVRDTKTARSPVSEGGAAELVRRIRSDLAKQAADEAKKVPPEQLVRGKILTRLEELGETVDPAAAFHEALAAVRDEDSGITAAARFIVWVRADPSAAIAFSPDGLDGLERDHRDVARELAGEGVAPETLLPIVGSLGSGYDDSLRGMARTLVSSRTVPQLAALIRESPENLRGSVRFHLREQWPAGKLDDFGAFVTSLDDPELIPYGSRQWSREELAAWILKFVDRHPDREFAERVRRTSTFTALLRDARDLPLKDRIAGLQLEEGSRFLAGQDVPAFLRSDSGPDLVHAFRHGRMDAKEVLSKFSARFPEYAGERDLPALLHRELCVEDPVRAAELLDALPEKERSLVMARNFREQSYDAPLDTLGAYLRMLPLTGDETLESAREALLGSLVDHGLDDYGPDYLDWISTLPDASDRQEALLGISIRIEHSMEGKAREIRRIVGDTPLPPPP